MNQRDIAHVIRTRTPYKVTTRPGVVVAWFDPWNGAIVRSGKRPTVIATIPDPWCMLAFVLGTFLTIGLLGLLWAHWHTASNDVVREIRWVFRKELGIETR